MRARARAPLLAALILWAGAAPAAAAGAWQTFIRVKEFTDLLALEAEVWGATAEGGLLRLDRLAGATEVIRREPGTIGSNRLTRLALDRSGRLWVGTRASGASRRSADASRWDVVNVLDGLPSDSVTVLEAQGDTVWIGTRRGIALWNGREITGSLPDGITLSFDTTFTVPALMGVAVLGDSLWLATPRGVGLARLSTLLGDWRPVNQGLASTDVRDLACDGQDLFARVEQTVHRFRLDLGRWTSESPPGQVYNLEDDAGVVLAAGDSGLFRWSRTATPGWTLVAEALAPAPGTSEDPEPTVDPTGRYFAASGELLYEQPPSSPAASGAAPASGPPPWVAHPMPEGPPGNNLLHVGIEGQRVYVTTFSEGVGRFDGAQWRYWYPGRCTGVDCDTTFIDPKFALGLLVDTQRRKWVACWSNALDSFDDSVWPPQFTHHVVPTGPDTERRTWAVVGAVDSAGGRWFGMDTPLKGDVNPVGLEYYDASGGYVGNFDSPNSTMSGSLVHGLTVSRNGRIWVGYDGQGLDFFSLPPDSDAFLHITATDNEVVRGLAAYGDSVWVLTNAELWRFSSGVSAAGLPAEKRPVHGGQPQLGVSPLAVGPDGAVWAGTSAGLHAFRPGGARDSFNTANSPLPDDEVRAVAVDRASGAIWITTASGLARFDPWYAPPPPPLLPALRIRVYPNPAVLTGLGIRLRLDGEASAYAGEVFDLAGRRLRRFRAPANGALIWDGRDDDGHLVKPGVYFVRAEAGGRQAVVRVALLR